MTDKIRAFYEAATEKLDEISAMLQPGAELTLIARFPGLPDQDILITADDYAEIVALIERRIGKAPDLATLKMGETRQ